MSERYKNNSQRYAFHMFFEGVAVLLVVGLLAFDGRVQNYLFGASENPSSVRIDLVKSAKPLARMQDDADGLSLDEPVENNPDTGIGFEKLNAIDQWRDSELVLNPDNYREEGLGTDESGIGDENEDNDDDFIVEQNGASQEWTENSPSLSPGQYTDAFEGDDSEGGSDVHFGSKQDKESHHGIPENSTVTRSLDIAHESQGESDGESKTQINTTNDLLNEPPTWWLKEYAAPQMPNRVSLRATLDEVVFVALRNSPQLKIFNLEPAILETGVREEIAQFDWASFAETRWNEIDQPNTDIIRPGQNGRFVQREWTYEAGLRKRLLGGGDVRFGQNYGTLDNNATFLNPPDQGSSRFVIDYTQPLLRGSGKSFNTSQILLAQLDLDASASGALENTQAFIVEVISAYWNLHLARVQLIQNRRSVQRAKVLLDQLRGRYGIDVSNDQLLRAEAAAAARQSDVISAEYNLINAQDILNNLTMGPDSSNFRQIELIPDGLNLPSEFQIAEDWLVEVAIQNRPEIRAAFARIKSAAVNQQIQTNLLLPQLDAIVQTSVNGLRGNKDFSGAFADQFTRGNPSYSVGLSYDLPIGNRAAKARVQRSELEVTLIQSELRQTLGDVILDVRIASREVMRLNQETRNNYQALLKASQELKLIRQRQGLGLDDRSGSSYIEDLLASQARLTAAELRLSESQRLQAIALVDLKRATGELLQTNSATCPSDIYAVPLQKQQANLPPIVHKLLDNEPDPERDFVPGVKANFQQLESFEESHKRQSLIKLLPDNDFEIQTNVPFDP